MSLDVVTLGKVKKLSNPGTENVGRFLGVNSNGETVPMSIGAGQTIIDPSLATAGAAADAKAAGDAIRANSAAVGQLKEDIVPIVGTPDVNITDPSVYPMYHAALGGAGNWSNLNNENDVYIIPIPRRGCTYEIAIASGTCLFAGLTDFTAPVLNEAYHVGTSPIRTGVSAGGTRTGIISDDVKFLAVQTRLNGTPVTFSKFVIRAEGEDGEFVGVKTDVKKLMGEYDRHPTFTVKSESLPSNTVMTACENIDGKKLDVIHFIGYFDADTGFDTLTIGHGVSGDRYGNYITINNTSVNVYSGASDTPIDTFEHALNGKINKWIAVEITHGVGARASLRIMSIGREFKSQTDRIPWDGCQGDVWAMTSLPMTKVVLQATFPDFFEKVMLFGDSYTSVGDVSRYPKHLIDAGLHIGIFGWGGETAQRGIVTASNVLDKATPRCAIWAYGMNNEDSDTAINQNWETQTEAFLEICESKGIIPILATIPCVPTRTHVWKNAWVRQSGYRYIDFATIVGGNYAGATWHPGMLEEIGGAITERVHPTELGAKALYHQFLSDVPEVIMQ